MIPVPRRPSSRRPTPARRARLRLETLERRDQPSTTTLPSLGLGRVEPLAAAPAVTTLTPAQVRHAYGFDRLNLDGAGQTIAIVTAYGAPTVGRDLRVFDRAFGLPDPPSFTAAMV